MKLQFLTLRDIPSSKFRYYIQVMQTSCKCLRTDSQSKYRGMEKLHEQQR